ncbi:hypothetical protein IKQ74_02725 [Candidatus Saccharibacteria bacterium]|nr:hypothetical protein [Candidatus Saccharibacteria bacterium]
MIPSAFAITIDLFMLTIIHDSARVCELLGSGRRLVRTNGSPPTPKKKSQADA